MKRQSDLQIAAEQANRNEQRLDAYRFKRKLIGMLNTEACRNVGVIAFIVILVVTQTLVVAL